MKQEPKWSGIVVKPTAVRSPVTRPCTKRVSASSLARPHPVLSTSEVFPADERRAFSGLPCFRSLEELASLAGTDEDQGMQECAFRENELRLRSSSMAQFQAVPDDEAERTVAWAQRSRSFPGDLTVPERPSNPMAHDCGFLSGCGVPRKIANQLGEESISGTETAANSVASYPQPESLINIQ